MSIYTDNMFSAEELEKIREQFFYVDKDYYGRERLFFDNAGGSLRLKAAEEEFHRVDSIPDASEHSNSLAKELEKRKERNDLSELHRFADRNGSHPRDHRERKRNQHRHNPVGAPFRL